MPENEQLSVLHIMFKGNALRYFTDHIKQKAVNVDQAFEEMKKHFITEAHINTYISEGNNLSFSDFRTKEKETQNLDFLDMLYYRPQDLQSILDTPYQSRLILRDCIIRAVKGEPFYAPLITMPIPRDPDELHTRLHQVMKHQDSSRFSVSNHANAHVTNKLKSLPAYHFENKPDDNGEL